MKTLKALFAISAILLVSGFTFASTVKGPGESDNVKSSVREKIATAIELSELKGQGQVTIKFGVTNNNNLEILKIESTDKKLSEEVKDALDSYAIKFPKGSKGIYQVKLLVNEQKENYTFDMIRNQVYDVVDDIEALASETVKVKLRVMNPATVKVLKAESSNQELAQKVKKELEEGKFFIPQKLNGEYAITVSFK